MQSRNEISPGDVLNRLRRHMLVDGYPIVVDLVNSATTKIRFRPALTVDATVIDECLSRLERVLAAMRSQFTSRLGPAGPSIGETQVSG